MKLRVIYEDVKLIINHSRQIASTILTSFPYEKAGDLVYLFATELGLSSLKGMIATAPELEDRILSGKVKLTQLTDKSKILVAVALDDKNSQAGHATDEYIVWKVTLDKKLDRAKQKEILTKSMRNMTHEIVHSYQWQQKSNIDDMKDFGTETINNISNGKIKFDFVEKYHSKKYEIEANLIAAIHEKEDSGGDLKEILRAELISRNVSPDLTTKLLNGPYTDFVRSNYPQYINDFETKSNTTPQNTNIRDIIINRLKSGPQSSTQLSTDIAFPIFMSTINSLVADGLVTSTLNHKTKIYQLK